jgi:hypothetical protein
MAGTTPMRRSHRLSGLLGGVALPEFLACSSFIVVAGPALTCDQFEVQLSVTQKDSQGIEDAQHSDRIVAREDIVDIVFVLLKKLLGLVESGRNV